VVHGDRVARAELVGQQTRRDVVLDPVPDHPLQRPRPELRVIAFLRKRLLCAGRYRQRQAAVGEP